VQPTYSRRVRTAAAGAVAVALLPVSPAAAQPASSTPPPQTPAVAPRSAGAVPSATVRTPQQRRMPAAVGWRERPAPAARTPREEVTQQGRQTTMRVYARPVFAPGTTGWRRLDPALQQQPEGWSAPGLPVPATFTDSGAIRLDLPGSRVSIFPAGMGSGARQTGPTTLTYNGIWPEARLSWTTTPSTIAEQIVLDGPDAPSSFTFHVADNQHSLGTARRDSDGGYTFSRVLDSTGAHLRLEPPAAFTPPTDTDPGSGVTPGNASMSVTRTPAGYKIIEAVDAGWRSEHNYPIVLDPTVNLSTPSTTTDCLLSGGRFATYNYCSSSALQVGSINGGDPTVNSGYVMRSLDRFDLSSIPSNAKVLAASYNLTASNKTTAQTTTTPLEVHALTRGFTLSATWNSYDGTNAWSSRGGDYSSTVEATTSSIPATASGPATWTPVTSMAQRWVSDPASNYGLLVRGSAENQNTKYTFLNRQASSGIPYLQVRYTTPSGSPSGSTATSTDGGGTVTWQPATAPAGDPDGAITGYTVTAYPSGSTSPAATTTINCPQSGSCPTAASLTGLTNGTGYYTTVVANNAGGSSPPATSNTFVPAGKPAPAEQVTADKTVGGTATGAALSDAFQVSWNPPTSGVPTGGQIVSNGAPITSYVVTSYLCATAAASSCSADPAHPAVTVTASGTGRQHTQTLTGYTHLSYYAFGVIADNTVAGSTGTGASTEVRTAPTTSTPPTTQSPADAGLGLEPWWTFERRGTGPQGTAAVNVGNGNLVVSQTDSTPVQAHGHLAYTLARTYNSRDTTGLRGGALGVGWQLGLSGVGDDSSSDTGVSGIRLPTTESLTGPQPITLSDRDGTRHQFAVKQTDQNVVLPTVGGLLAGLLTGRLPAGVVACQDTTYTAPPGVHLALWRYRALTGSNCGNPGDTPPAGSNPFVLGYVSERPDGLRTEYDANGRTVSLKDRSGVELRYLYDPDTSANNNNTPSTANPLGGLRAVYEPASCTGADGSTPADTAHVLAATDSTCRGVRFATSTAVTTSNGTTTATLPAGVAGCPTTSPEVSAAAATVVCASDPAARSTYYQFDSNDYLIAVRNPDGTRLAYTYGTACHSPAPGSGTAQLCGLTDPLGHATALDYGADPTGTGPNVVASITDRRGTATAFTYTSTSSTNGTVSMTEADTTPTPGAACPGTAAAPCERTQYSGIDPSSRVALVQSGTGYDPGTADHRNTTTWLHSTTTTWDTAGGTPAAHTACQRPEDNAQHNNPCRVVVAGISSPDSDTSALYGYDGELLRSSRAVPAAGSNPATTLTSTYGYHLQYWTAPTPTPNNGPPTQSAPTVVTYAVDGGASADGVTSTGTPPANSLFVLSDATQALPPRGNAAGPGGTPPAYTAYLTTTRRDVTDTAAALPNTLPATPDGAKVCSSTGAATTDTGLACETDSPVSAGNSTPAGRCQATGAVACTVYDYDGWGQRRHLTSPKNVAAETAPQQLAMTYAYAVDNASNSDGTHKSGSTDLSGTSTAGGWLSTITDPTGHFVAFGYDAAGHVARSWDRDATAGQQPADFPGTLAAPPSPAYTETLYADPGPTRDLTAAQEQTALSQPWRWALSQRDQLGNRSRTVRDADGNATRVTSPRGVQAATTASTPTSYDTTVAYDAGDLPQSVLTPAEAKANGASNDTPATYGYDAFGNKTTSTDPKGARTAVAYDPVNRPTTTTWSRGASNAATPPANCRQSTPADTGFGTGLTLCSSSSAYDGLDHPVSSTDATGLTSTETYDGAGRAIATSTPRNNNNIAATRTGQNYDADSHVVDSCTAREFTEGSGSCTPGSVYATHTSYDTAGHPVSNTRHRDSGTAITSSAGYDADGNAVTATDPDGNTTTTTYDALDRASSMAKPRSPGASYTTATGYDPVGNKTYVQVPVDGTAFRTTGYSYDADNRLTDTVAGANSTSAAQAGTATADGGSNVRTRKVYDADGHTVGSYSARAFTASTTSPDPRFLTRTDIDADGRPTATYTPRYDTADPAATDPTGAPAADCPTGANPAAVPVPASMPALPGYPGTVGVCVVRTGYDPDGQAVTTTMATAGGAQPGQTSRQTTSTYTDDHLLASTTGPSPTGSGTTTTSTTYDAVGDALTVTDPLGHVTTTAYTADHLPASTTGQSYPRTNPDGTTTTVTHVTSTSYDAAGEPVAITDALGQTATTAYTADGRTASSTNTGGGVTSYAYDLTGNTTKIYSPSANAKDPTNPGGVATENTYTADNLLATTLAPPTVDSTDAQVRHQVVWSYDQSGLKTTATHNSLDTNGNIAARDGLGGSQQFSYYPNGRLQTQLGRGNSTATPEHITTTYDPAGNPLTAADSTGGGSTVTSSYYLNGLPRTVDDGHGGRTATGYDGNGQTLTRTQTSPNAPMQTSRYSYNDAELATRQTSDTVGASMTTPWTWTYDAAGRTTTSTTPEGQTTRNTYNDDNSLRDQTATRASTTVSSWTYTYDNLSRQLAANSAQLQPDNTTAAQNEKFGYDSTGRLVSNTDIQGAHASTYDADGNRLTYTNPGPTGTTKSTTTYNADDSIRTHNSGTTGEADAKSYYRASGALQTDGCTTYNFDGFDRMAGTTANTTSPTCVSPTPRTDNTYTYDALDRQRSDTQAVAGTNTSTTTMNYSGQDTGVATETTDTTASRRYTLGPGGAHTAMTWTTGTGALTQPHNHYLGTDGKGSITEITGDSTASGTPTGTSGVACATRQDPWGKTSGSSPGNSTSPCPTNAAVSTPTTSNDIYYRGERRDNNTGNYQLGTRTYDPAKTAFLSQDTYRFSSPTADLALGTDPLTSNRYTYVNGDPVNLSDPTGHVACFGCNDGQERQHQSASRANHAAYQRYAQAEQSTVLGPVAVGSITGDHVRDLYEQYLRANRHLDQVDGKTTGRYDSYRRSDTGRVTIIDYQDGVSRDIYQRGDETAPGVSKDRRGQLEAEVKTASEANRRGGSYVVNSFTRRIGDSRDVSNDEGVRQVDAYELGVTSRGGVSLRETGIYTPQTTNPTAVRRGIEDQYQKGRRLGIGNELVGLKQGVGAEDIARRVQELNARFGFELDVFESPVLGQVFVPEILFLPEGYRNLEEEGDPAEYDGEAP